MKTIQKIPDYFQWVKEHGLSHSPETIAAFIKEQVTLIRKKKIEEEDAKDNTRSA